MRANVTESAKQDPEVKETSQEMKAEGCKSLGTHDRAEMVQPRAGVGQAQTKSTTLAV